MKNNLFSILVRRREKRSQSNKAARPQGQRAANWFQMDTAGGSKKSNTAEMKINTRFCEVSPDIYQKKKKKETYWDSLVDMMPISSFFFF